MPDDQSNRRTVAEVLASLNTNLDHYEQHIRHYSSMAYARDVAADIRDLLALLQPRHGADHGHPGRIAVTLHGLDVYVERTADRTEVSFGTDELPDQYPVEVEVDNNRTTVFHIN
jgi:hypothetical protein